MARVNTGQGEAFTTLLLGLPLLILHEEYGWGATKRLPDFMDSMILRLKAIESGEVKPADLISQIEELMEVKIQ